MMADARASSVLQPDVTSKIYGIMNFLEQGTYGRIGTNGLVAIKERQYEKARRLTPPSLHSFEVIQAALRVHRNGGSLLSANVSILLVLPTQPWSDLGAAQEVFVWYGSRTRMRPEKVLWPTSQITPVIYVSQVAGKSRSWRW
eukprot:s345_g34.t1